MQLKIPSNRTKEILSAAVITIVTASILSPVIATTKGASAVSNCQANLKKISNSMRMYLADWNETYPTNRNSSGKLIPSCRLGYTDADSGQLVTFGTTWVEGLYRYMPKVTNMDTPSPWKCPAALRAQAGIDTAEKASAAVTYVINFNLLERSQSVVKNASKMMLLRETDRLVASQCCGWPSSVSATSGVVAQPTISSSDTIYSPFFRVPDLAVKSGSNTPVPTQELNTKLHGNGSQILFADGHVKLFNATQYFKSAHLTSLNCWDNSTSAFYNTIVSSYGADVQKAIQVTP